ncbi:hypothetical protein QI600_003663 [Salmonella enterica]|nr:hypothetical protein [Salmonella enterica]
MHKDDLKHFRKGIKDTVHSVRVMGAQLNEGSYRKLESEMRSSAAKLNAMAEELNAIIEQQG